MNFKTQLEKKAKQTLLDTIENIFKQVFLQQDTPKKHISQIRKKINLITLKCKMTIQQKTPKTNVEKDVCYTGDLQKFLPMHYNTDTRIFKARHSGSCL